MAELRATLETVTPLFLGGADPRGTPELRAASVRGALRFWLRALRGGILGDQDLETLRTAEAAVFGSTDTGASPVVVRIQHGSLPTTSFSQLAEWDNAARNYRKPGIAYVFFAARRAGQQPERSAISTGSSFEVTLSNRAGLGPMGDKALRQAYAGLWLLTHLGGLGARPRRGGGSLQVTKVEGEPNDMPSLIVRANNPAGLLAELKDGLTHLRQLAGMDTVTSFNNSSAFDVLHPSVCRVWVVNKTFHLWSEALDEIGKVMQKFRNRLQPDYGNVKSAVQGRQLSQPVQRAAFGLPIVFYYSSLDGQQGTLEGEEHDRRASPLMVRVTKLANGQYTLVLTMFLAQLLPHGERLKLRREGPPARAEAPNLNLIDQFLRQLDNDVAARLEVKGW